MGKHHLIISGTGRAGTTFLVQLLTELGLDTGFSHSGSSIHSNCNAGMEQDIRNPKAPYVVKSPTISEYLAEYLAGSGTIIDYAIIPVRDLYSAAESRRDVFRRGSGKLGLPGGLWLTKKPAAQESVLARQLHQLIHTLVEHDVPMIWLHFPRLVKDPDYLFAKLKPALPGIDAYAFDRAFQSVSRPELVHNFRPATPKSTGRSSLLSRLRERLF